MARDAVRFWNERFNMGYAERDVRREEWLFIIGGLVCLPYAFQAVV